MNMHTAAHDPRLFTATALRLTALAIASALVLGYSMVLAPAAHAESVSNGFTVSPLKFDTEQSPGSSSKHTISIMNTTGHNLGFSITTEDIAGSKDDPNATPVLLGGTVPSPISGASWVTPNVDSFKLGPGDTRNLTVSVTVPAGATGGHYAAVMISSTSATSSGGGAVATSRAAVLMMMNAGGVAPPELVIQDVTTTKDGGTIIDYVNKGQKAAKPEAIIEYYDVMTGSKVAVRKATDCGMALPGGSARCKIDPRAGSGTTSSGSADDALLVARPVVELRSDGRRERAKEPLQMSGSWASVLLPLTGLLLAIIWFGWWRRRRRADDDDDLDIDDTYSPAF